MSTITKETLLDAGKLAAIYSAELQADGWTPKTSPAASPERLFRSEFQNGELNSLAIPFGRLAKWATLFPAKSEFNLEFQPGKMSLDCGNSRIVFLNQWIGEKAASSIATVPPIRFDDCDHSTPDLRLIVPPDAAQRQATIKSASAAAKYGKLRKHEIQAKQALRLAVSTHCENLEAVSCGVIAATAKARTGRDALRAYRGTAERVLSSLKETPVWLLEAIGGDTEKTHDLTNAAFRVICARKALAEYKPRNAEFTRANVASWKGRRHNVPANKRAKLEHEVKQSECFLNMLISRLFGEYMDARGLPHVQYSLNIKSDFSKARQYIRLWPAKKMMLAQDYVSARAARIKATATK